MRPIITTLNLSWLVRSWLRLNSRSWAAVCIHSTWPCDLCIACEKAVRIASRSMQERMLIYVELSTRPWHSALHVGRVEEEPHHAPRALHEVLAVLVPDVPVALPDLRVPEHLARAGPALCDRVGR